MLFGLIYSGCYNKIPWQGEGLFKRNMVLEFWRLGVQDQGANGSMSNEETFPHRQPSPILILRGGRDKGAFWGSHLPEH